MTERSDQGPGRPARRLRGTARFGWRRPSLYTVGLVAVMVVFVVLRLSMVSPTLGFGNDSYYIRDALTFARGDIAYSRYSPGFPLLLVPIVWATGGDPGTATLVAEMVMAGVAVLALLVLHRVLRRHASPGIALALVGALALGQVGMGTLGGVNPEPLVVGLVAATLLLPSSGKGGMAAAALAGLAVLVRVALAPFFGILWLLRLRRHPGAAVAALILVAAAGLAHFATGPREDQSYVAIAQGILEEPEGGETGLAESVTAQVGENLLVYGRYGIPRLVWPFRLLDTLPGLFIAGATVVAMAWGLLPSRRNGGERMAGAVIAGTLAYLGLLLTWPVRVTEAVRLVVPVAPVLLSGLAMAAARIEGWKLGGDEDPAPPAGSRRSAIFAVSLAAIVLLNLAAGLSAFAQNRVPKAAEEDFRRAHVLAPRPDGPVISQKPAVSELLLGVPAYGYPAGDPTGADLASFSERLGVCYFVVDGVVENAPLYRWVGQRTVEVLGAAGETRLVRIDADWCPGTG